jgi:hypothetical protein
MRPSHRRHRPRKCPPHRMKHRQRPKVMTPLRLRIMRIQRTLNDIPKRRQIRPSMRVHHPLRTRRCPRRIRQRQHTLFIHSLRLQSVPTVSARLAIKRQTLRDSAIELPLHPVRITIRNHLNTPMALFKLIQQMLKLPVNNNSINLRMLENIRNILLFQPIINRHVHRACCPNAVNRF